MEFAQRLNELLEKKGITAYRLSKTLGIHQTTIKNWIDGNSTPRTEFVQKMADFFGVSPDYLMGWSNNKIVQDENEKLSLKDKRDISKDLNRIMEDIKNDTNGLLYYNGEPIDEESLDLFRKALELGLAQLKRENKARYNPNKNKIQSTNNPANDQDYLLPQAAHERTDIEVTDEMRKADDDIMNDDDFWK